MRQAILEDRRRALKRLAALLGSPMVGCAAINGALVPVCPRDPAVSLLSGPLSIDAHCHVFNGTDLQIKEFLSRVAVRQEGALGEVATAFGAMLQSLGWHLAPSGDAELQALREIPPEFIQCDAAERAGKIASLRQLAYQTGRTQLQEAVQRTPESSSADSLRAPDSAAAVEAQRARAAIEIRRLPEDVEEYRAMQTRRSMAGALEPQLTALGMVDFVLQNFQYRYVSAHDYLRTYNEPGARVMDLVLAMLVDYDWWLAKGRQTPTSISAQVSVMEQVSILTRGRVHAFVPFCPLRQVAYQIGVGRDDALQLAKHAVANQGCLGVKLYPPMGFAALGNAAKDDQRFWQRDWLPDWTARPDLGQLLDGAMGALCDWCQSEQVPIMAHTGISNGPAQDFEELAGASHWGVALKEFPRLRVSFGHFGSSSPVEDGVVRAKSFCDLMSGSPTAPGSSAFADAAYFVEVLNREPALRDALKRLYEETAQKGSAALANRLMYGTDWEMTLVEGSVSGYLSDFVTLMNELEARPALHSRGISQLSARFFGSNAVTWLGLRKGDPARNRLDAFYARNGVPTPDWMVKVDRAIYPWSTEVT